MCFNIYNFEGIRYILNFNVGLILLIFINFFLSNCVGFFLFVIKIFFKMMYFKIK